LDTLQFINSIKDYAIQTQKDYNILTSLTLAQAVLESASGTSELAINANALFGIKWSETCGYDKYLKSTKEYENGQEITINAYFRKYNSWQESIIDHA
jgi:flagellum-specific peptidoglycan hydrolase FlgJ